MKPFMISLAFLTLASSGAAEDGDLDNGKLAYATNCLVCHGENGDGKGPAGVALQPPPRDFSAGEFAFDADKDGATGTDADLLAVIQNGAAPYGGSALMTPWAHLPEKDIKDLISYIRTLTQAPAVSAK